MAAKQKVASLAELQTFLIQRGVVVSGRKKIESVELCELAKEVSLVFDPDGLFEDREEVLAVDHGLGGGNSQQRALDLVDDIEDLFKTKRNIDPHDFAELLDDEIDERFNTLLEDGSAKVIANHICQSFMLLRDGRTAEVGKFLEGLPNVGQNKTQCAAGGDDSSDEDDEGDHAKAGPSHSQQQLNSQESAQLGSDGAQPSAAECGPSNGQGDASMEVEEEEDGWTTIKKGGKRR